MTLDLSFFLTNILLGIALAMDAFSVSLSNGLSDVKMSARKMYGIAGMFALFQALMPFIGWVCVHTIASLFEAVQVYIPWVTLAVLGFLGGKMIYESLCGGEAEVAAGSVALGFTALVIQAIATSIDALSAGLSFSTYNVWEAMLAAGIIAAVTFPICAAGVEIGKRFGTKLAGKAGILGGSILVVIGVYSVVRSLLG